MGGNYTNRSFYIIHLETNISRRVKSRPEAMNAAAMAVGAGRDITVRIPETTGKRRAAVESIHKIINQGDVDVPQIQIHCRTGSKIIKQERTVSGRVPQQGKHNLYGTRRY